MNNENIIRVDHSKENPYLQVSKKTIRDVDLDLQSKGLLIFLLAKPDNWRIRPDALAKELGIGKTTVCYILNRLIKAGYVHRTLVKRNDKGRFQIGALYIVFEQKDERREWADKCEFDRAKDREFNEYDVPF